MRLTAITYVQDDDPLLPVWERYYKPQADAVHFIDGSKDVDDFNPDKLIYKIQNEIAKILKGCNAIVFADLDEYIVPDPDKYAGLRDYVERMTDNVAFTHGYDVIHAPGEAPINWKIGVLSQRTKMVFNRLYCKPLIAKTPQPWSPGFHHLGDPNTAKRSDHDLVLFHLLLADFDTALHRIGKRRNITAEQLNERMNCETVEIPERFRTIV